MGKTNQKQDGGNNKAGAYGFGMRDTCRADGDETYRRAKGVGVPGTPAEPERNSTTPAKHSSKMLLQKSAGLARILLRNKSKT